MWFGDLVTMAWWNGLWLNEAFATFMGMMAVDVWKPQWRRWTSFGISRASALVVDGLNSTRPIEFPVTRPEDAEAMFDVLTYEKGASVLRMFEQYLGADTFRAGVRLYLKRHAFGNTETGDLWRALGEASGQPIPEMLDGWVFRPGYPLVTVRAQGDVGNLVLSQERFRYLPADGEETADSAPWQVPVRIRMKVGRARTTTERVLLTGPEADVDPPAGFGGILVNEGGHGFYRVRYERELLGMLLDWLPDGLAPVERFNLVNDSWALVLAALTPLREYLAVTARFRGERDPNVWAVLAASFHALNRIAADGDRPALAALVRDRAGPAVADLGWAPKPGEDELTRQLRGDLLRQHGTLGDDPGTQAKAAAVYAGEAGATDAGVLAAAIAVLAHAGDEGRYREFAERFRTARTPQEEQRYLAALALFRQPPLVERTLAKTLDGEVRTQDAPLVLRSLLMSVHGRALAWEFVKANWAKLNEMLPPVGVRRTCEGVIGLATPEWEADVRDFFARQRVDLGGKTLAQYLEQLRVAVRLREREGPGLSAELARAR
jgi:puromycin-sensitive aminopeptidase